MRNREQKVREYRGGGPKAYSRDEELPVIQKKSFDLQGSYRLFQQ